MRMTHHSDTLQGLGSGALLTTVEPVAVYPKPGEDCKVTVRLGDGSLIETRLAALTVQDSPDQPDRLAQTKDFPKIIISTGK